MNNYTSKIIQKKEIANNVYEIHLEKPADFAFESGQFMQVIIPMEEKEVLRSYSISSTPDKTYIELCIKLLEDGIGSNFFRNISEGDEITFKQANGRFIVKELENDLFFIATGAGLAPIISMIEHEINKGNNKKIKLLFGVRHEVDIFWKERLENLATKHENFTYQITLSGDDTPESGILQGRVSAHIPEVVKDFDFYLCGSPAMIQDVRKILVDKGEDAKDIHFEIF